MKKFQVISRDSYGTTIIINTCKSIDEAVGRINSEVTNANFENALTTDDQYRSIEAYFPIFVDEDGNEVENLVYAGNNTDGKHRAYRVSDNGDIVSETVDDSMKVQIFIGAIKKGKASERKYFRDSHKQNIDSLQHEFLEGKTHYYIKVIG